MKKQTNKLTYALTAIIFAIGISVANTAVSEVQTWHYDNGQKGHEYNLVNGKGLETGWYENGQKESEFNYVNDERNGLQTGWYESGQKEYEYNLVNDEKQGLETIWHQNGQKLSEFNYVNDEKHVGVGWDENGRINSCYRNGSYVSLSKCSVSNNSSNNSSNYSNNGSNNSSNSGSVSTPIVSECVSIINNYGTRYIKNTCNFHINVWFCVEDKYGCNSTNAYFDSLKLLKAGEQEFTATSRKKKMNYFACKGRHSSITNNTKGATKFNCSMQQILLDKYGWD